MPARPGKPGADALRAVGGRTGMARAAELAAFLQKSEQTLANWRWQGKGPRFVGRGRGLRYDWVDVGEWLTGLPEGGASVRRGAA